MLNNEKPEKNRVSGPSFFIPQVPSITKSNAWVTAPTIAPQVLVVYLLVDIPMCRVAESKAQ